MFWDARLNAQMIRTKT